MLSTMKRILKRLPLLSYFYGNFVQRPTGKRNATYFTYRANFQERPELEVTKINQTKTLYADRMYELTSFFEISRFRLLMHYVRNGTPNTNYYRKRLENIFNRKGTGKSELKRTYELAAFMYANRIMLRYHNYRLGLKVLELCKSILKQHPSKLRVLDYGCGVADPSLLLALNGANVTIVDLEDKKFQFAQSRFVRRNLCFAAIGAQQTEQPVAVSETFDVIFMAEFLEHVRRPRLFLEFAIAHVENGGILYDSLGPVHQHGVGGQHLKEAKEEMESTDYFDYFHHWLKPVNVKLKSSAYDHFYIKERDA